jgi:hypothetical protein
MAGLAAVTSECNDHNAESYCAAQLGLEWTAVVFQLVVFALVAAIIPTKFGSYAKYLLAGLLVILTTLHMQFAQDALVVLESDKRAKLLDSYKTAVQGYTAGAVLLIIVDLLLIAYLTLDIEYDADKAVIKTVDATPAMPPPPPVVVVQPHADAAAAAPRHASEVTPPV